jgi:predicted O-methyltransferase YrrM
MSRVIGASVDEIVDLYRTYAEDLRSARARMKRLWRALFVRADRPTNVVEISPCDGWSTHWILRALSDNGGTARLRSFDLHDGAGRNVLEVPNEVEWTLDVGDVREAEIPDGIDFLYIDSDHRAPFAEWYLANVLPRSLPDTRVCIDDIYHDAEPADIDGDFGESRIIHDWLHQRGIPFVTASASRAPEALDVIRAVKRDLGMADRIRQSEANSTVFFARP